MKKFWHSVLALAALSVAVAFSAPAFASTNAYPAANPMETQSVSKQNQAVQTTGAKELGVVHALYTFKPFGALSLLKVAQTECRGCKVVSVHPGCSGGEQHPLAKKGGKGKGGGGKKCMEAEGLGLKITSRIVTGVEAPSST